jgi:hypothetical protein
MSGTLAPGRLMSCDGVLITPTRSRKTIKLPSIAILEVYMTVQVNIKLDDRLVRDVDWLVDEGHVKTKKEAFERGLVLLLRACKASDLERRIERIREDTEKMPSVTQAVVTSHEEES